MAEDKRISYPELMQRLEIKNMPSTRKCASCGQTMHPVVINKYIVFFVHDPSQFDACSKVNPTGDYSPLIWSNKHMIRIKLDEYYKEVTGKEAKPQ